MSSRFCVYRTTPYFRSKIRTAQILASYKRIIGIAIIVCEKISGVGVMIPPAIKATTTIIRRCFARKAELMIPILAAINNPNGRLKMIPNGKIKEIRNDKYCPSDSIGCRDSLPNPRKNLMAAGHTSR